MPDGDITLYSKMVELFDSLPWLVRIVSTILFAIIAHFLIKVIRRFSEWIIEPSQIPGKTAREIFSSRHPKFATIASLVVSIMTFTIYFLAFGILLREFNVSLTAYLATASIVGLAVAFGSQGIVQDVVTGTSLVFSDTFDIGDMIEIAGQIGRVENVGLRYTKIVNVLGQAVYIPNRNIAVVGRYKRGTVRAYVDIQIPQNANEESVKNIVDNIANGMRNQHRALIITDTEIFGIYTAEPGGWKYIRLRFRIWPGQNTLIENIFRQRVITELKKFDSNYADWMVTVTYRVG